MYQVAGDEMDGDKSDNEERDFIEFRRKVRSAEILSAAVERLLCALRAGFASWCRMAAC
jgi:hypothetical protein